MLVYIISKEEFQRSFHQWNHLELVKVFGLMTILLEELLIKQTYRYENTANNFIWYLKTVCLLDILLGITHKIQLSDFIEGVG